MKRKVCGHEGPLLALGAGVLGAAKAELELLPAVDLARATVAVGTR